MKAEVQALKTPSCEIRAVGSSSKNLETYKVVKQKCFFWVNLDRDMTNFKTFFSTIQHVVISITLFLHETTFLHYFYHTSITMCHL